MLTSLPPVDPEIMLPVEPDTPGLEIVMRDTIPPSQPDTLDLKVIKPDTIPPALPDTLENGSIIRNDQDPEEEEDEEDELEEIAVWPADSVPGYTTVETDSTLRWFMALNWSERLNRQPGVITYRLGRLGHPDGIDIYSYENRHQRLQMNEMDLGDAITGQINWNRLPIHKIRTIDTDDRSYAYQADLKLRQHYLVEPRTYLNFDEGSQDYRNLEFAFSHNLRPATNVELSYWDRRDGTRYPRDRMEGSQIVAKARHHLSDHTKIRAGLINNSLDLHQSFGYQMTGLDNYPFNPFIALAVEGSAATEHSTRDLYLQLLQRSDRDGPARRMAGISYQTDRRDLRYSRDTTAYNMRDAALYAWQELQAGPARLRLRGSLHGLHDRNGLSMNERTFFRGETSASGEIALTNRMTARLSGRLESRNDGFGGYELSASGEIRPWRGMRVTAFGGQGSTMPDLQSLYWNSVEYQGNPDLSNESGAFGGGSLVLGAESTLSFGIRGDIRRIEYGIFLGPDSLFINAGEYRNRSGNIWLKLDSERFEGEISASTQRFESGSPHPVNRLLDDGGDRIWLKGQLFWKDYVFSRAAFVKAGVSGILSPRAYRSQEFVEPLNRWQHGSDMRMIPEYHRLDAELSARVRWFMVLLRMENVLDRVNQLGYFETDSYPMPPRRFIFAFRVVFMN